MPPNIAWKLVLSAKTFQLCKYWHCEDEQMLLIRKHRIWKKKTNIKTYIIVLLCFLTSHGSAFTPPNDKVRYCLPWQHVTGLYGKSVEYPKKMISPYFCIQKGMKSFKDQRSFRLKYHSLKKFTVLYITFMINFAAVFALKRYKIQLARDHCLGSHYCE